MDGGIDSFETSAMWRNKFCVSFRGLKNSGLSEGVLFLGCLRTKLSRSSTDKSSVIEDDAFSDKNKGAKPAVMTAAANTRNMLLRLLVERFIIRSAS